MRFDTAGRVEEVVWSMRLAELPRAGNRAIIQQHFNGAPPYDASTAEENGVQINKNFLEGPNLLAQARRQWNTAFLKSGNYFAVTVDSGPAYKRKEWGHIITKNINQCLKRSPDYMEYMRSMGANMMLHGIAPADWDNSKSPIPIPLEIDDVLIPSETLCSFRNLDHFAVFRQYSPATLYELTHGPKLDPGWNMDVVDAEIKVAANEYQKSAYSVSYQFQPEKIEEYIKQDLGFWGSDAPPTIDVWDFYFRECEDGNGWYRRVVLDSALSAESRASWRSGGTRPQLQPKGQWLYTSGKRKYANSLRNVFHCQFGDCSAFAPFRYHSVRSLGFMLFGVCELQNRLRCRFTEAVFEQLMWFFKVGNENEFRRLKKAVFEHMGVIPQGIEFVTADQRFKPDAALISLLLGQNRQLMSENAASFTQDIDRTRDKEMTATETMARVNAVNAMVSSMLNLAYTYETYQYRETCRRFCIQHSPYPEVRKFQLACLDAGVPKELLDSDRWDVEPERVLGSGNKTLELAQADKLLLMRPTLGPEAQQMVDHIAIESYTDDPALAESLAPMEHRDHVSRAKQSAMLAVGTLMQGGVVQFTADENRIEIIETLLVEMALIIQRIQNSGQPPMAHEISGLQNIGTHIAQLVQSIAQDKNEKQRVKRYSDELGNLMNIVKGFAQQLAEQQQQMQGANGNGQAAETAGKIQAQLTIAEAKAANQRESHAQRTAQRQVQFEAEEKRKSEAHQLEVQRELQNQQVANANAAVKTASEIQLETARAAAKPKDSESSQSE